MVSNATSRLMKIDDIIVNFILESKDAYAVFTPKDKVIYCNDTLEDLFCFTRGQAIGKTFPELILNAYQQKAGINVNTDKESIHTWIANAQDKRRKRKLRLFEIDLVDGRWMLVSEQVDKNGYLFLQAKNITRQKILESQLSQNVDELNTIAMTDELTQIANRRSFIKHIKSNLDKAGDSVPYALIVIDIDDFKLINDQHGHAFGDTALKEVANIFKRTLRPYDVVGRIGGEEFAIFLYDVDFNKSKFIANRVVENVANEVIVHQEITIKTSISAGLIWSDKKKAFEELYVKADELLYQSKTTGKNKLSSSVS